MKKNKLLSRWLSKFFAGVYGLTLEFSFYLRGCPLPIAYRASLPSFCPINAGICRALSSAFSRSCPAQRSQLIYSVISSVTGLQDIRPEFSGAASPSSKSNSWIPPQAYCSPHIRMTDSLRTFLSYFRNLGFSWVRPLSPLRYLLTTGTVSVPPLPSRSSSHLCPEGTSVTCKLALSFTPHRTGCFLAVRRGPSKVCDRTSHKTPPQLPARSLLTSHLSATLT